MKSWSVSIGAGQQRQTTKKARKPENWKIRELTDSNPSKQIFGNSGKLFQFPNSIVLVVDIPLLFSFKIERGLWPFKFIVIIIVISISEEMPVYLKSIEAPCHSIPFPWGWWVLWQDGIFRKSSSDEIRCECFDDLIQPLHGTNIIQGNRFRDFIVPVPVLIQYR